MACHREEGKVVELGSNGSRQVPGRFQDTKGGPSIRSEHSSGPAIGQEDGTTAAHAIPADDDDRRRIALPSQDLGGRKSTLV